MEKTTVLKDETSQLKTIGLIQYHKQNHIHLNYMESEVDQSHYWISLHAIARMSNDGETIAQFLITLNGQF
jgi:hypothetical protein